MTKYIFITKFTIKHSKQKQKKNEMKSIKLVFDDNDDKWLSIDFFLFMIYICAIKKKKKKIWLTFKHQPKSESSTKEQREREREKKHWKFHKTNEQTMKWRKLRKKTHKL